MNAIETIDLTKTYGKARGVTKLNLAVKEGDIYGFIGPNGAGKSTTIRTLLGLISPTSGSAKVLGMDCQKEHKKILENIGYMPSEALFYNGMKVSEIISFSAKLHKKDCSAKAKEIVERLQLDPKKRVEELSLGNRKKVSIVCALQHEPRLCILDEPTSGLDPLMQKEFFDLLEERNKAGGTIFLSSHILSEIQRHADNAAIIRDGKLIVEGSVEELSKTNARRVNLSGVTEAPQIDGIMDVQSGKSNVSFLYKGDVKRLVSALGGLPLSDMTITEPDLEEIFMHFYEEGGETK